MAVAQQQVPVNVAEAKVPVPGEPVGPIVPDAPTVPSDPVPSPDPAPPGDPMPPSVPDPDPDRDVPIDPPGAPQTASMACQVKTPLARRGSSAARLVQPALPGQGRAAPGHTL